MGGSNKTKPYVGYCRIDGVRYYLGRFATKAERRKAQDDYADAFCRDYDKCRHRNHGPIFMDNVERKARRMRAA